VIAVAVLVGAASISSALAVQIARRFDDTRTAIVRVEVQGPGQPGLDDPAFAEDVMRSVPAVRIAAVVERFSPVGVSHSARRSIDPRVPQVPVIGLSASARRDLDLPGLRPGAALLGEAVAAGLGIGRGDLPAVVWLDGVSKTVIGLVGRAPTVSGLSSSVILAPDVAREIRPDGANSRELALAVVPGTAAEVARLVPHVLTPTSPTSTRAAAAPDFGAFRQGVEGDLAQFVRLGMWLGLGLTMLGLVALAWGSVGQREQEMAIRIIHGARPRDLRAHLITEAIVLGAWSGSVGAFLGGLVAVGIARSNGWAARLDLWVACSGPAVGALACSIAAVIVVRRVVRVDPAEVLRR